MKKSSPVAQRGASTSAAPMSSSSRLLGLALLVGLAIAAGNPPAVHASADKAAQFDSVQWMVLMHRLDANPLGVAIPAAVSPSY